MGDPVAPGSPRDLIKRLIQDQAQAQTDPPTAKEASTSTSPTRALFPHSSSASLLSKMLVVQASGVPLQLIADAISRMLPILTHPEQSQGRPPSPVLCEMQHQLPLKVNDHHHQSEGGAVIRRKRCCRNPRPAFEDDLEGARMTCENCGTVYSDLNHWSSHSGDLSFDEKKDRSAPGKAGKMSTALYHLELSDEEKSARKKERQKYELKRKIEQIAETSDRAVDCAYAECLMARFIQNQGVASHAAAVAAVVLSGVDVDEVRRAGKLPPPPEPTFGCECGGMFHSKRDLRVHRMLWCASTGKKRKRGAR